MQQHINTKKTHTTSNIRIYSFWATYVSIFSVNYAVSAEVLTTNVDLQLTEVCRVVDDRKLHDEVSVRRHVGGTRQVDCGSGSNSARVLTADGVVPEGRCRDGGWDVGQTDDEVVRSVLLKQVEIISVTAERIAAINYDV